MGSALIGGGLSIAGGIAGGTAADKASIQSAKDSAYAQDLNTGLQTEIFQDQTKRNQPYLDFGDGGVNSLRDGYDFRQTPEYMYRQQLGGQALGQLGQFDPSVLNYARGEMGRGLDMSEQDDSYSKIIDRIKIRQGQAATSGQGAQQYGSALANAYTRAGNTNALSNMYRGNNQQDMMNRGMAQASGIPAYIQQQNYLQSLNNMPSGANSQYAWDNLGRGGAGGYR